MKDARKLLNLSMTAFRSLIRKGIVFKEITNNGKFQMLQSNGKNYNAPKKKLGKDTERDT